MTDATSTMGGASAWLPRSVECLRHYSARQFVHDLIAGVTVGLVALPLAMAFAIASGVSPQAGLYTAVVAGFVISALGGSRTQIGGPTGAFVVIVAGIVAKFGVAGLALVGVMLGIGAAFGLTRFLASFLFGVKTWDPVVFVAVPLILAGVALLAVWLPATRASKLNPMVALRVE